MRKIKEKPSSCVKCDKSFIEITYHAKGMCQKCYSLSKYKIAFKPRKKDWTHCVECNLQFGSTNERGRLISKGSNGYCKSCYGKIYNNLKQKRSCDRCGVILKHTTRDICKACYQIEKDNFYRENPNARKSESYKNKILAEKAILTDEQFELVRRLFVKFKIDTWNLADMFRVADVYLEVFTHDVFLDSLPEKDQVVIMLSRLKPVWDRTNVIKKTPPKKKRKYTKRATLTEQ